MNSGGGGVILGGCWDERNAFVRASVQLQSRSPTLSTLLFFLFLSRARDSTTFTLHDLADFYVESVIIKINDHS